MQINFIPKTSNRTELKLPNSTEQSNDGSFSSVFNAQNSETTLESIFKEASDTYQVPLSLLKAVGKQESNFNPKATSRCGAQGIMQLMPATAAGLGVTDAYDSKQNIMGGAKYLSELLSKYDGNTTLALAAYNAGSDNARKIRWCSSFQGNTGLCGKSYFLYGKRCHAPGSDGLCRIRKYR